jgi:hypothetical protein
VKVVSTRISDEAYEALLRMAKERGLTLYDYIREALEELARKGPAYVTVYEGVDVKAELSRLGRWVREIDERLYFVEEHIEPLLSLLPKASTPAPAQAPTPASQAQAPQQLPPAPSPQPQPSQQPQQPPPEPKLIPASELPEAKKVLEEKAVEKVELRPFVIKRNPSDPERYRKWLESHGRTVTGEVEEVTKKGPVRIVFGTTPEVVDKICEKLTELKVPVGALDDALERARLDRMFAEEPFVDLGTRAYLLSRACLIIRDRDGTWRRV